MDDTATNYSQLGPLFIGVYPGGIVYADRTQAENNDYKRVAFLAYHDLVLTFQHDCPLYLQQRIRDDAATLQARRGEQFPISSSGQTVLLGSDL